MISEPLTPLNFKPGQGQAFNLNLNAECRVYDVSAYDEVTVQAEGDASWGTAEITLRRSNDGRHARDLWPFRVKLGPGTDFTDEPIPVTFRYLHVDLTTVEGAADTCELTVRGIRYGGGN